MAIVTFGGGVAAIRGRVGGVVFSANGVSSFVKTWAMPILKQTEIQSEKRGWFVTISHAWGELTQVKIDAWDALAATPPEIDYNSLGEVILLSGYDWHMRINMRRLQAGQIYEDDAPVNVAENPPQTFGLTAYESAWAPGVDKFTYTDGDFAGDYAVCHVYKTSSGVRQVATSGFLSMWCGTVEQATWTRINEELIAAFGMLKVGEKLFGRLWRQASSGIRSTSLVTTTVVLEEP